MTLVHREAGPEDGRVALMLHGFPESSYMWHGVMPAVADAGWRAVAPDFAGFGDSPPDPPGTWERQVEGLEAFRREVGIERCVLAVHDWGGLIGLRWACEHPDAIDGLVISSSGFFPDGKWNDVAQALRTPDVGEQVVGGMTRDSFGALMRNINESFDDQAIDEYWKGVDDDAGKRNALELYRSGDFEAIARYRLADLDVPVLLIWGGTDALSPVAGAHRFDSELRDTELHVMEDAGHFIWDEQPERCAEALTAFLARIPASSGSST